MCRYKYESPVFVFLLNIFVSLKLKPKTLSSKCHSYRTRRFDRALIDSRLTLLNDTWGLGTNRGQDSQQVKPFPVCHCDACSCAHTHIHTQVPNMDWRKGLGQASLMPQHFLSSKPVYVTPAWPRTQTSASLRVVWRSRRQRGAAHWSGSELTLTRNYFFIPAPDKKIYSLKKKSLQLKETTGLIVDTVNKLVVYCLLK